VKYYQKSNNQLQPKMAANVWCRLP